MVIGLRGEVLKPLAQRWTAKAISFGFPAHTKRRRAQLTAGTHSPGHRRRNGAVSQLVNVHKLEVSLADARSRASHGGCAMTRPP